MDDIKKYRKAKLHKRNAIPFDQAFKEIEEGLEQSTTSILNVTIVSITHREDIYK